MADSDFVIHSSSPGRTTMSTVTSKPLASNRRAKSPPRSPLQEKSNSQANANIPAQRKGKQKEIAVFASTPFPTKPQHILLPSTVRKQRSFQNVSNTFFTQSHDGSIRSPEADAGAPRRTTPLVQLKKSVTSLRDMYEEQERSSRPSTATSLSYRPNSRLRSASSSDGLSGRNAWEKLQEISSDDLALLPSLNEALVRRMGSEQSFASRIARTQPLTSTPNYRVYATSSPRVAVFRDDLVLSSAISEVSEPSSDLDASNDADSSPNFVRLGYSSSTGNMTSDLASSSSPNFVKLGTSSPAQRQSNSPTPSTGSDKSLKRKRSDTLEGPGRSVPAKIFNSSPPYIAPPASASDASLKSPDSGSGVFPSSPPILATSRSLSSSSPVIRLNGRHRHDSDSSTSSSAHASLQAALSSSPMPPIQYPIVRAPTASIQSLNIPKRGRTGQLDNVPFAARLSPVPSEWEDPDGPSKTLDDFEEELADSISSIRNISNDSQVRIFIEDDREATDELSALPASILCRSPPTVPVRTNSLYGTITNSSTSHSQSRLNSLRHSMDSRLNSMKSFTISRRDSTRSGSMRPASSGSYTTNVVVPTWARRYYSGYYRDSFQYLYPPSQNNSSTQLSIPPSHPIYHRQYSDNRAPSTQLSERGSRGGRRSLQSIRSSLRNSIIEFIPQAIRPRPDAHKSHHMIGVWPLVSHPVRPSSAIQQMDRRSPSPNSRCTSASLPSVDPRAHWAGVNEQRVNLTHAQYPIIEPQRAHMVYSDSGADENYTHYYQADMSGDPRFSFLPTPTLHRDRRLNTSSTKSRGFGFPFNKKSRFMPPTHSEGLLRLTPSLRTIQKLFFALGFLFPFSWFLASALPLPPRPIQYADIEKAEWDAATHQGRHQLGFADEMDVVARLRMERHVKGMEELEWQNARWWRHLNRAMSVVGVVVVLLVVILAIVGTRNRW